MRLRAANTSKLFATGLNRANVCGNGSTSSPYADGKENRAISGGSHLSATIKDIHKEILVNSPKDSKTAINNYELIIYKVSPTIFTNRFD